MAFPKQFEIELPLLRSILNLGGAGKPKDIYPLVTKAFDQLTQEDLEAKLPSSPSTYKWHNLVQWVRQSLVEKGELDGTTRGVWKITQKGRLRLKETPAGVQLTSLLDTESSTVRIQDLINQNEAEVKRRILVELKALKSREFEQFCVQFLQLLGYRELNVTGHGKDGGIDGFGHFRQGVVNIRSAFQAKRWRENTVSRPEIDKFRGAIQGEFDHGVFLTTSSFTKDAQEASIRKGAITLLLMDGEAITETMIKFGIGVTRQPVHVLDINRDFFRFEVSSELL